MPTKPPPTPLPAAAWIVFCAFCNCIGWALSAIHQLNLAGYSVALLGGAIAAAIWWKRADSRGLCAFAPRKFARRFRRPFAMAFLLLAALAFVGGAIHAPNNFDGLTYRTPRVLHWLAEGQWHWIHTGFQRLNVRAVGFEWVTAPFILFTRSDRLLFLINFISFLLLPGLVFSVFTRLGVRARVAWHWMWVLPSAYCFVLQAGSIGNDLFGAVFALMAMDFALRARAGGHVSQVWLACLAAALLTASKASNLPLLLPIAIALFPALPLLKRRFVASLAVMAVAAMASLLPMALLNIRYCGDWSGQVAEQAQFDKGSVPLKVANNAVLFVIQNFAPPVFPVAKQWNAQVQKMMPPALREKLEASFEPGGAHWALDEMQMEEGAGLGFGVSALLLICLLARLRHWRPQPETPHTGISPAAAGLTRMSGFVALLAYMVKAGLTTAARLITPYYALLIPSVLAGGSQTKLVRSKWWRRAGMLVFLGAGMLLVISPSRPLWPAQWVLSKVGHPDSALLKRAQSVYTLYGERADGFAPLRDKLPADAGVVGFISFDNPETSLWKPFGSRRIRHVRPEDTAAFLRSRGIDYVLINSEQFPWMFNVPFAQWLNTVNGELVWTLPLSLRASRGPTDWQLIRLRPDDGKKA